MKPQLNFKVMAGLYELDRLIQRALVTLPAPRKQDEIIVARRWIREMGDWWREKSERALADEGDRHRK